MRSSAYSVGLVAPSLARVPGPDSECMPPELAKEQATQKASSCEVPAGHDPSPGRDPSPVSVPPELVRKQATRKVSSTEVAAGRQEKKYNITTMHDSQENKYNLKESIDNTNEGRLRKVQCEAGGLAEAELGKSLQDIVTSENTDSNPDQIFNPAISSESLIRRQDINISIVSDNNLEENSDPSIYLD